ncbi:polysaccharide deacetylase [Caballeronia catudaia]|uniref:Polysaccharide deacetylase n=1 Tax=Caballeronia catudaia TaxID=1777136 RepID=A0A158C3M1_9BURK|nr:polysaccharide deacetylase family protein [Caballeronia catudaia]SAK76975.1 polysaccharide deacetylase [Caballeronia catudaia]
MKPHHARAVPVLMYHHVSNSPGMLTVTVEHFTQQIAYLRRAGYQTLGGDGLAAFLCGERVPARSVVITFDDGYLDNWVFAHPILQRWGFKALCFLVTSWPGDGPVRPTSVDASAESPRVLSHEDSQIAIQNGKADDAIMRWSEIEAMRRAGTFEFHSHTHTHRRWDHLTTSRRAKRACLTEDLRAGRNELLARLGTESRHLCWPEGFYDGDYREIALNEGFNLLYTCNRGTNPQSNRDNKDAERTIARLAVRDRPASWLATRLWIHGRPLLSRAYLSLRL